MSLVILSWAAEARFPFAPDPDAASSFFWFLRENRFSMAAEKRKTAKSVGGSQTVQMAMKKGSGEGHKEREGAEITNFLD